MGPSAKAAIIEMLFAESVPIVRINMLKDAGKLDEEWFIEVLIVLTQVDDMFIPSTVYVSLAEENPDRTRQWLEDWHSRLNTPEEIEKSIRIVHKLQNRVAGSVTGLEHLLNA